MAQFYSPKPKTGKVSQPSIKVTVNDLDAFGQGIAKHRGKTLFIAGALPGEDVEIKITEDKRQYAKANVIRRFNDSPLRIKPHCVHFGQCGGCQQQHASPELQRQSKLAALQHLLERQSESPLTVGEILSGDAFHYRRRARLGLQYDVKSKRLIMGFRKTASNDLVEITQCPVLQEDLERLIIPLKVCLESLDRPDKLGHVELVSADSGLIIVLRHLSVLSTNDRQKLIDFAKQYRLSVYLAAKEQGLELLFGHEPYYAIDGLNLFFSPQGFIQVNKNINQKMIEKALEWLDINKDDRTLDLFCGVGNFTLPIAKRAGFVVGIEGVNDLVELGRRNAGHNQLNNVQFFHENLESDLSSQQWARQRFNKVLLDPARAGAFDVMSQLIKLSPQTIVYVSCNPATLARDCKILLTAGYKLKEICMIDMFPNTGHLESMILLTK